MPYVVWNDSQRLCFMNGIAHKPSFALWMSGSKRYTKFPNYEAARNSIRMTRRYMKKVNADWERINGPFSVVKEGQCRT